MSITTENTITHDKKTADSFSSMNLIPAITQALTAMEFKDPTPIQLATIPAALEGRDILGSAPTGTGKTGAFSIPLVSWILHNPQGTALIMTPTRELALQVLHTVQLLIGRNREIKTALLIGGKDIRQQFKQLQLKPRIIVGTPGRINDHLNQNTVDLSRVGFLVLDETDRMLDFGFQKQLVTILNALPDQRQTLLFSATLPPDIKKISESYLSNALRVAVGQEKLPEKIQQETLYIDEAMKYKTLLTLLEKHQGSVLIFSKTKFGCERLSVRLRGDKHSSQAIHGDLRQSARDRVLRDYRDQRFRVLVATDVAARGLDIPHIGCVINFDLPQCPEDYVHRIGRTGRAGAEGIAINFVSPADGAKWRAIGYILNPNDKPKGRPERSRHSSYDSSRPPRRSSYDPTQPRQDRTNRGDTFAPRAARSYDPSQPRQDRTNRGDTFAPRTARSYDPTQPRQDRTNRNDAFAPRDARNGDRNNPFKKPYKPPFRDQPGRVFVHKRKPELEGA